MIKPTVEKLGHSCLGWLKVRATFHLRDQAGAFDLGLSLSACEAVPFALAFAGRGIALLENDCPMAG
jgi:hypothetical protein